MSSLNQAISNIEKVGASQAWFLCSDCKEMRPPQMRNYHIFVEEGSTEMYCKMCTEIESFYEQERDRSLRELKRDMRYE